MRRKHARDTLFSAWARRLLLWSEQRRSSKASMAPEQIRIHGQHAGIDAEIDPLDARRIAGGGKCQRQRQKMFAARVRARSVWRLFQPARQSGLVAGLQSGIDPAAEFI